MLYSVIDGSNMKECMALIPLFSGHFSTTIAAVVIKDISQHLMVIINNMMQKMA